MMPLHRQQGAAAVEMAVILVPMLMICFAITELGRALYLYNGLVKATHAAARYLSMQDLSHPPVGETLHSLRDKAISLAYCGELSCGDAAQPIVPGLRLSQLPQISVCDPINCPGTHRDVDTGQGTINLVTVMIGGAAGGAADAPYTYGNGGAAAAYEFTALLPWVIPSLSFGPISSTVVNDY